MSSVEENLTRVHVRVGAVGYGRVVISTCRLRLRRPRDADVDAVYAYRSRSDVAQFLSAGTWTREHTAKELSLYEAARFESPGDERVFVAELRGTGQVIGEVGLVWLEASTSAEIGYVFNPDFGGTGLATEAVGAVLAAARGNWGFSRVVATTDATNGSSRALCERVGMVLVSTAVSTDGRGVEELTYAVATPAS